MTALARWLAGLAAVAAALVAPPAWAQRTWWSAEPLALNTELPDATAPPSLVDLTHRGLWYGVETTFASLKPYPTTTGGSAPPRTVAWLMRAEGEVSIYRRRWYAGAALSTAYGQTPGSSAGNVLLGYPEIWTRAVWASRSGLAYGGGLSAVIPVFKRDAESDSARVAESVRVVRPWDFAPFADNTLSLQPYLDARVIDGRVSFQLRQGFVIQGLVAQARLPNVSVVSRTTLSLGYQPSEYFALGLEVQEVYFISTSFEAACQARRTSCDDSLRAVFAVSPSVRLLTRVFQPSLSILLPFDRTLYDSVDSYWGLRLGLSAVYGD